MADLWFSWHRFLCLGSIIWHLSGANPYNDNLGKESISTSSMHSLRSSQRLLIYYYGTTDYYGTPTLKTRLTLRNTGCWNNPGLCFPWFLGWCLWSANTSAERTGDFQFREVRIPGRDGYCPPSWKKLWKRTVNVFILSEQLQCNSHPARYLPHLTKSPQWGRSFREEN